MNRREERLNDYAGLAGTSAVIIGPLRGVGGGGVGGLNAHNKDLIRTYPTPLPPTPLRVPMTSGCHQSTNRRCSEGTVSNHAASSRASTLVHAYLQLLWHKFLFACW